MTPATAPAGTAVDVTELMALRALAAGLRRAPARRAAGAPGTIAARRRGQGLDVDDVRPWTAGDDLRHIDRNATARTGQPHVRRFRDERDRTVLLVADLRPSMLFGTRGAFRSVAAARALSLIGWRCVGGGCRVGLLVLGSEPPLYLPPVGGERAMPAVIGALSHRHDLAWTAPASDHPAVGDPPLDAAIEATAGLAPRDGLVVLASAFEALGPDFVEALLALRRRAEIAALLVLDAFEQRPPRGAYPFIRPDGRGLWGAVRRIGHADPSAGRRMLLARAGLRLVVIDAAASIEAQAATLQEADAFPA